MSVPNHETRAVEDTALALTRTGMSVVSTQGKKPTRPWADLQRQAASAEEVARWYDVDPTAGVAVICGPVSGNLIMVESEGRAGHIPAQIGARADARGLGDLWRRVSGGWSEQSPSGGMHWFVRSEGIQGNRKLARRPSTPEELAAWKSEERDKAQSLSEDMRAKRLARIEATTAHDVPQVLAETRETGGYSVVAPTSGAHHESGRPWVRLSGGPSTAATLTSEELDALLDLFRSFDEMPKRETKQEPQAPPRSSLPGSASGEVKPGEDFEARTSWAEILEPHGWTVDHVDGATTYWTRPGKNSGISATTGHAGDRNRLYVFSSSVPDFEPERPYTKFAAYAALEHGGDMSAAARDLSNRGYGSSNGAVMAPQTPVEAPPAPATTTPNPVEGEAPQSPVKTAKELLAASVGNSLDEYLARAVERGSKPATPTGIPALDEALQGGLQPGLYVAGAVSSLGKTTLAVQIGDYVAASGARPVIIFSLEQGRDELIGKSLSRISRVQSGNDAVNALKARGLGDSLTLGQEKALDRAIRTYEEQARNLWIYEGVGNLTTAHIRKIVSDHVEALEGMDPPLVIVDYLQIIAPDSDRLSDKQAVDRAITELKRISRDYELPIIVVSSLNRASYSGPVSMQAFKESGAVEYGSDVLLGIQPAGLSDGESAATKTKNSLQMKNHKKALKREVELVVLKNRNGPVGATIPLVFEPVFSLFRESEVTDSPASNWL